MREFKVVKPSKYMELGLGMYVLRITELKNGYVLHALFQDDERLVSSTALGCFGGRSGKVIQIQGARWAADQLEEMSRELLASATELRDTYKHLNCLDTLAGRQNGKPKKAKGEVVTKDKKKAVKR